MWAGSHPVPILPFPLCHTQNHFTVTSSVLTYESTSHLTTAMVQSEWLANWVTASDKNSLCKQACGTQNASILWEAQPLGFQAQSQKLEPSGS